MEKQNKQMIKYHDTECHGIKIVQNLSEDKDRDSFIALTNRMVTNKMSLKECQDKIKSRDLDLLVNIAFAAAHIAMEFDKQNVNPKK